MRAAMIMLTPEFPDRMFLLNNLMTSPLLLDLPTLTHLEIRAMNSFPRFLS
jgi:hypothetical protein